MKAGEARGIYSSVLKTYNEQKFKLSKQRNELKERMENTPDGKTRYADEAATLELKYNAVAEKYDEYQSYVSQLMEQWNSKFNSVVAKQQVEVAKDYGEEMGKIMTVARRIMHGDQVPMQDEKKLTYVFITHDLSVVKHISHEIMVMYLGQCVEYAKTEDLFKNPLHPYTKGLLDAVPIPSLKAKKLSTEVMRGELTSPVDPAPGCRFAARCPYATDACRGRDIPLKEVEPGHFVSCTRF